MSEPRSSLPKLLTESLLIVFSILLAQRPEDAESGRFLGLAGLPAITAMAQGVDDPNRDLQTYPPNPTILTRPSPDELLQVPREALKGLHLSTDLVQRRVFRTIPG